MFLLFPPLFIASFSSSSSYSLLLVLLLFFFTSVLIVFVLVLVISKDPLPRDMHHSRGVVESMVIWVRISSEFS